MAKHVGSLKNLRITATPFEDGRYLRAGNWSAVDWVAESGALCRSIHHYSTQMGTFRQRWSDGPWIFAPESVGYGSVGDQDGMNRIMAGYGWYFSRRGGAGYDPA